MQIVKQIQISKNFQRKISEIREVKRVKLLGFEYRPFYNIFSPIFKQGIKKEAIILWGYCNFECIYCKRRGCFRKENGSIVTAQEFSLAEIVEFIQAQNEKETMIRISGGEPLIAPFDFLNFIFQESKKRGLITSIATNMSSPEKLERLLPRIDYLAGDFKAPKRYWEQVTGADLDFYYSMQESWRKWAKSKKDGEMRFVIFPFTQFEDIKELLDFVVSLSKTPTVVFRAFKSVPWLKWPSVKKDKILKLAKRAYDYYGLPIICRITWKKRTAIVSDSIDYF